jgi:hypothetical protein
MDWDDYTLTNELIDQLEAKGFDLIGSGESPFGVAYRYIERYITFFERLGLDELEEIKRIKGRFAGFEKIRRGSVYIPLYKDCADILKDIDNFIAKHGISELELEVRNGIKRL